MLRIYNVVLELIRDLRPQVEAIERRDRALGDQLRRALASCPLNLGEGTFSQGRNRRARYFNSLGSWQESLSCFDVAIALGYVEPLDAKLTDRCQHVRATLIRLVR